MSSMFLLHCYIKKVTYYRLSAYTILHHAWLPLKRQPNEFVSVAIRSQSQSTLEESTIYIKD